MKYSNKQLAKLADAFFVNRKGRGMHLQNNFSICVFLMFLIEALAAGVSKKWSKTRYLPSSGRGGWDVTAVMIYSGYALVQIVVVGRWTGSKSIYDIVRVLTITNIVN